MRQYSIGALRDLSKCFHELTCVDKSLSSTACRL